MGKSEARVERAVTGLRQSELHEIEVRKHVSPAGKLKLPKEILTPLLEERRLKYAIPDSAFNVQPSYDTLYLFQLGGHDEITFEKGGVIEMPEAVKSRVENESPRGIIISAGLIALDSLRGHGVTVGDIVNIVRFAPYRLVYDIIGGQAKSMLVLHAGDVKGSEDTMARLRSGELKIKRVVNEHGVHSHVYVWNKETIAPVMPTLPEE